MTTGYICSSSSEVAYARFLLQAKKASPPYQTFVQLIQLLFVLMRLRGNTVYGVQLLSRVLGKGLGIYLMTYSK